MEALAFAGFESLIPINFSLETWLRLEIQPQIILRTYARTADIKIAKRSVRNKSSYRNGYLDNKLGKFHKFLSADNQPQIPKSWHKCVK